MVDLAAEDTTYLGTGHRKIKLELSWKLTFPRLAFIVVEDSLHRSELIPGTVNLAKSLGLGRSPPREPSLTVLQVDIVSNCLLNTFYS